LPTRRPSTLKLLAVAVAAMQGTAARAGVLDDPNVGGVGFGGPTTGDLTAIYWNPAALGLMQGVQVLLGVSAQRTSFRVARAPIDPVTGAQGGSQAFAPVTGNNTHTPVSWPPGPGTFLGVGASVGNRFTLAIAVYTPLVQRAAFGAAADGSQPARFHAVDIDLRNVALVPALALRIGNDLRLGVAPGFLFSTARLVFDEDTGLSPSQPARCGAGPCPAESPAAAARYDVGSGLGLFQSSLSFTVGGGIHYRRGRLEVGLAFSSRPLGNQGGGVEIDANRTSVTPSQLQGPNALMCPPAIPSGCVSGHLRYDLPDIFTAGATWHATPRLAVTTVVRWLTYSRHDQINLRVVGPATGGLRTAGLPERIVLYRGFRDVIEGRVRVEREMATWLRLGAAVRADSGAVPAAHLSPAAVGGPTVEPALMAELRIGNWLRLTAGYALSVMPTVDTGTSVFDPTAARTCASPTVAGDLGDPSCMKQVAGTARPTAAGRYGLTQHTGTLTATFRF
jgi:long-subunit fatty acid transport protein